MCSSDSRSVSSLYYLDLEKARQTHRITVEVSGGGLLDEVDVGRLDGVLHHMQNDDYYPTFADKLTHLFFCTCQFHCFQDGNKRLALSLSAQFLLINGYVFIVPGFLRKMENISYHVAAGRIDKELLKEIIAAILDGDDDNEALKFKIWKAIS